MEATRHKAPHITPKLENDCNELVSHCKNIHIFPKWLTSKPPRVINSDVHADDAVLRKLGAFTALYALSCMLSFLQLLTPGQLDSDPWSLGDLCCLFVFQLVCLLF